MRRAQIAVVVGLLLWVAIPVWARPPEGKRHGRPETTEEHAKKAAQRVGSETVDAVADELTGTQQSGGSGKPPGLAKKGKTPPGLEKQGKTPPGWEKGRKEGWDKNPPKEEGFIRRVIHGIFHGGRSTEQKPPKETKPQ